MKKKRRFFLDFWPYVCWDDILLFWGSIVITIVITIMGGWPAFFAGLLVVLPLFGHITYENRKSKDFFEQENHNS